MVGKSPFSPPPFRSPPHWFSADSVETVIALCSGFVHEAVNMKNSNSNNINHNYITRIIAAEVKMYLSSHFILSNPTLVDLWR